MLIRVTLSLIACLVTCGGLSAADKPASENAAAPSAEKMDRLRRGISVNQKLMLQAATQKTDEAAEDKGDMTIADEVDAINKEYAEEYRNYLQTNQRFMRFQSEKRQRLMDLVKNNPKDPAAMDAVMLLVERFRAPLNDELIEQISAGMLSNPKAGEVCLKLTRPNPQMRAQESLLKKIAAEHSDEQARGLANFALGEYYRRMAQTSENDAAKQSEYLAQAEKHLNTVKNDYASAASVAYNRSTIGEKTESELLRVRNLPNLKVGAVAPEIEATDMDGNKLKLSDSRGKVTVLIFWGSWCGPCMALVPHEKELYERMQGKPFAMVSVNCGDPMERAQATRTTKEMAWPCWWDGGTTDGPIQAAYNVPHYPRIFVIDAKGVIRNIDVRNEKLDEAVDKLIEELDAGKTASR